MSATSVLPPFPIFTDSTGTPLESGYIYIGTANLNPEINPIAVYWDIGLTIPAAQPIRTNGGYPVRNGTPAALYVAVGECSILVRDKNGALIFSGQNYQEIIGSEYISFIQSGAGAISRTVRDELRLAVSSAQFGAVGDGLADDTLKLQAALDAGAGRRVIIEPGTYLCGALIIHSNTTLIGSGAQTIIKAIPTLPNTSALLANEHVHAGGLNGFVDANITVEGIIFDGNGLSTLGGRTAELVGFSKVSGLTITRCGFTNHKWFGLLIVGCRKIEVSLCKFSAIGEPTTGLAVAGPALAFGSDTVDGTHATNILTFGNTIEDCNEAGILVNADYVRVVNNYIFNVKEGGIVLGNNNHDMIVTGNHIDTVGCSNISSSGIECFANNLVISNNRISNVLSVGIAAQDGARVTISGNQLHNIGPASVKFPQPIMIGVISTGTSTPNDIVIEGNIASMDSGAPYAMISVGNAGPAPNNVSIFGNVPGPIAYTSGEAIHWDAGKRGANCISFGNGNAPDAQGYAGEITTPAAPGSVTINCGFQPRKLVIKTTVTSALISETCDSITSISGTGGSTSKCHYVATNGTNQFAGSQSGYTSWLVSPTGVLDVASQISALTETGFTILFTTTTIQANMMIEAFP